MMMAIVMLLLLLTASNLCPSSLKTTGIPSVAQLASRHDNLKAIATEKADESTQSELNET